MENLIIIQIIISVLTLSIATISIVYVLKEYRLSAKQKRSELFDNYRIKFETDPTIKTILQMLDEQNDNIDEIPRIERYHFLGLYEEIALLLNSGLIKKEVAHYMFGYFAIECWENESFWRGINRTSGSWMVFKDFVEKMNITAQELKCLQPSQKIRFEL